MSGKDRAALHKQAQRTKPQWLREGYSEKESIADYRARQEAAAKALHDRARPHTCGPWAKLSKPKEK